MSLQINHSARFRVTLEDGRTLDFAEGDLFCAWAFGNGGRGDFGEWMNFMKWLAEQFGAALPDPLAACRAIVEANDRGMAADEAHRAVEMCRAAVAKADEK